jgi:hypothetical protein
MKGKAQGEREFSHGVRTLDLRRRRYLGLTRTKLQQIAFAAAINLVRVFSWLSEERPFTFYPNTRYEIGYPLMASLAKSRVYTNSREVYKESKINSYV